jgi:hypothetical protein
MGQHFNFSTEEGATTKMASQKSWKLLKLWKKNHFETLLVNIIRRIYGKSLVEIRGPMVENYGFTGWFRVECP